MLQRTKEAQFECQNRCPIASPADNKFTITITELNAADLLTKPLTRMKHRRFVDYVHLRTNAGEYINGSTARQRGYTNGRQLGVVVQLGGMVLVSL